MKALLVTIGSLGDLHPFIAIGQSLQAEGVDVTLAVPLDYVAKVEAAGLAARPVLPSFGQICTRLGLSEAQVAARTLNERYFVIDQILLPALGDSTASLDRLADQADVIVGSVFAFAARIVAEKRGLPLVDIVLQPMTLFSAWQPPHAPGFQVMRHGPNGPVARTWNRLVYRGLRHVMRRRYGSALDQVRKDHGLARSRSALLIDPSPARVKTLCCYSPVLGLPDPDAPPDTHIVGFPFFDSATGAEEPLDPRLAAFLAEGPPPIVFSLGSFAWAAAGDFFGQAAAAAQALGRRAIFLTGGDQDFSRDGDHASVGYAPHSLLFGHCEAIVHHGGIGSTGQALRAGRPQLIVPLFGDQYDNAARLRRLGVGEVLPFSRFTGERGAAALGRILGDPLIHRKAATAGRQVAAEDGSEAARQIIAAVR